MENYNYTGINKFGKRVTGVLPAANEQELEQKLLKSDVDLLSYRKQSNGLSFLNQNKVTRRDVINLTFQMEQLLRAGVSLLEIINDLKDNFESDAVKEMLANISESMEGGATYSEALRSFEKEFGEVYISLVSVGEKTGKLEDILLES